MIAKQAGKTKSKYILCLFTLIPALSQQIGADAMTA